MLVRDLLQTYVAKCTNKKREDARHAAWWKAQAGREDVSTLTTALVIAQLDRLASYGRSPSTANFYLRFFRRVCAWAFQEGILSTDPCTGIALPKPEKPTVRVLSTEEETRLCIALGHPYDAWVKFALETGLKLSEQFSLRWREVDLVRAQVLLPAPTGNAVFHMHLSLTAVALLRQLRESQPPSMWCFPDPKTPHRPVNVHSFLSWRWGCAVREACIPWLTWKDLRTTCGVRLAEQGYSIEDVVARMRQAGNSRAYLYRCTAEKRSPKSTPKTASSPYSEKAPGELAVILARDLQAQPVTFHEAARLYAVHHLGQRDSRRQFERVARQFWQPWMERPLESLTRKEIRAWYLDQAHIPSYANKALNNLRAVINWALDLELITCPNPALRIKRFPAAARERFLSTEELQRMIEGLSLLPSKIRAYLLILLLTGARSGEARQLRWRDIDETSRVWTKPTTKNKHSHRVPLPLQVMEALEEVPRVSAWVFPGRTTAHPWSSTTGRKQWMIIRQRWGLSGVTLHDLRRSCASMLAMHGENLPTIQAALGHRSLTPTSVYARLNVAALDRALQDQANRLGSLYAPQAWLSPTQASGQAGRVPVLIEGSPSPKTLQQITGALRDKAEWPG